MPHRIEPDVIDCLGNPLIAPKHVVERFILPDRPVSPKHTVERMRGRALDALQDLAQEFILSSFVA
jgi:hypothetical protein